MVPTMSSRVSISLWDKERVGPDKVVASAGFKYGDLADLQDLQLRTRRIRPPKTLQEVRGPGFHVDREYITEQLRGTVFHSAAVAVDDSSDSEEDRR